MSAVIDHVSISVSDLAASVALYDRVLGCLGLQRLVSRAETVGYGKRYPEFWLNARPGMAAAAEGTGAHVCLRGRNSEMIDAFHAAALAAGASDDGAPGLRPEYAENYYAAFFRDADGNRIEAVTFVPDGER